jgi:hypothetical protein
MANEFYNNLINQFRGIRTSIQNRLYASPLGGGHAYYTFGTIVSGSYLNYKHDPTPTIFVMHGGEAASYGQKHYVHGLNTHYLDSYTLQRFMRTLFLAYRGNQIINPRLMYQYIKLNFPVIVQKCYRMYHLEMCEFKIISPGITQIPLNSCYGIKDRRDGIIMSFNNQITQTPTLLENRKIAYNQEELQNHIVEALNSKKIL